MQLSLVKHVKWTPNPCISYFKIATLLIPSPFHHFFAVSLIVFCFASRSDNFVSERMNHGGCLDGQIDFVIDQWLTWIYLDCVYLNVSYDYCIMIMYIYYILYTQAMLHTNPELMGGSHWNSCRTPDSRHPWFPLVLQTMSTSFAAWLIRTVLQNHQTTNPSKESLKRKSERPPTPKKIDFGFRQQDKLKGGTVYLHSHHGSLQPQLWWSCA